jgi:hypothetical protein
LKTAGVEKKIHVSDYQTGHASRPLSLDMIYMTYARIFHVEIGRAAHLQ